MSLNFHSTMSQVAIAILKFAMLVTCILVVTEEVYHSNKNSKVMYLKHMHVERDARKLSPRLQWDSSLQQLNKISASDSGEGDYFGGTHQVAISDNILIVGAFGNQDSCGAVYIYKKEPGNLGKYSEMTILRAPTKGAAFGDAVDISGKWIAVGAPWQRNDTGAVHMFQILNRNGTQNQVTKFAKITASDKAEHSSFGLTVALDGNILAVGANDASIYIYGLSPTSDKWSELTKLQYNGTVNDPGFGYSVDVSGDIVVVGTVNANAAFVYQASADNVESWTQVATLTPSNKSIQNFGYSVAVSGDYIVVGDHENQDSKTGIVFVYRNVDGKWTGVAQLVPEKQTVDEWFGFSVSISEDASTIVVGSASRGSGGTGKAYLFHKALPDQWTFAGTCVAEDGTEFDDFGRSVALSENLVFVGAPSDSFDTGSVYVFSQ
jgi:hypothetical protein